MESQKERLRVGLLILLPGIDIKVEADPALHTPLPSFPYSSHPVKQTSNATAIMLLIVSCCPKQWNTFPVIQLSVGRQKLHTYFSGLCCFLFLGLTSPSAYSRKASKWKPNSKSFMQTLSSTRWQPLHAIDNRHPQFSCTSIKRKHSSENISPFAL